MKIKVLSLFDGYSGGQQALKSLGFQIDSYYASEIDESAIKVTQKNHPETIQIGDASKVYFENGILKTEKGIFNVGQIDLVIGGSPCQGFSRQGLGYNFDDPRSALFFEWLRICHEVCPRYFFLENVVMKTEWQNIITEKIGVEPLKINSGYLSAQKRERIYWTNIPQTNLKKNDVKLTSMLDNLDFETYLKNGVYFEKSISEQESDIVSIQNGAISIKQATKSGFINAFEGDGINLSFPKSKTRRGRVISQKSPTLDTSCNVCVIHNGIIRKLGINELERLQGLPDNYTDGVPFSKRKQMIGNGWQVDTIKELFKNINL